MAETTNGTERRPDGRFGPSNTAARRHGLRAGSRHELRRRNRRVSRLLSGFLGLRADAGRPISPTQLPLARRYVEAEILASDLFSLVMAEPANTKAHERWVSATRTLALVAAALGESASSMAKVAHLAQESRAVAVAEAQKRLRAAVAADEAERA